MLVGQCSSIGKNNTFAWSVAVDMVSTFRIVALCYLLLSGSKQLRFDYIYVAVIFLVFFLIASVELVSLLSIIPNFGWSIEVLYSYVKQKM